MSTIRKVAKQAGVSIATVSRVVNGRSTVAPELRERVLTAISRCGYAPTVGRRSEVSMALAYAGKFTVDSPYDAACFDGIVTAMLETEFDLKIIHLQRDKNPDETYSQFFIRKGIRGAIVRTTSRERDVARAIGEEGFPSVVLGDHFDDPNLTFAFNDSRAASWQGIEHLISLGHRRIAFASSETEDGDHIDRREGYRGALMAHDLYDERLVFRVAARRLDGERWMQMMMGLSLPPTAVFIADPLTAVGAINGAHKLGVRLPEDLSVLGFDDTDMRHSVHPSVTAVCQDAREVGRLAFGFLMKRCVAQAGDLEPAAPGEAWLEINDTTGDVPKQPIRILPNGDRLEVAAK
jgi:LacI family transcriptional regulator, galactose operon repressor